MNQFGLRGKYQVLRRTSLVLDPATATASMDPNRQPVRKSCIQVKITGGTTGSGTVTVAGTVDGSPDTEILTFTANGQERVTLKEFTGVTASGGITTTGFTDEGTVPTIQAKAVGVGGQAQEVEFEVVEELRGNIVEPTSTWPALAQGASTVARPKLICGYRSDWTPRRGDVLIDLYNGDRWILVGRMPQRGGMPQTRWELPLQAHTNG